MSINFFGTTFIRLSESKNEKLRARVPGILGPGTAYNDLAGNSDL